MAIYLRSEKGWDEAVGWDKNRKEVKFAPDLVREQVAAVCALFREDLTNSNESYLLEGHLRWMVGQYIIKKKQQLKEHLIEAARQKVNEAKRAVESSLKRLEDARKLYCDSQPDELPPDELNKVWESSPIFARFQTALKKAQKELQDLEDEHIGILSAIQGSIKEIESLPWPDPINRNTIDFDVTFDNQPAAASSTGFAFAECFIMTAGHSFEADVADFTQYKVVFNYEQSLLDNSSGFEPQSQQPEIIKGVGLPDKVYSSGIKRIIFCEDGTSRTATESSQAGQSKIEYHDVAFGDCQDICIAELQKPNHSGKWTANTLQISNTYPQKDEEVYLLGHPMGLPMKYISKASDSKTCPKITSLFDKGPEDRHHTVFKADIDSFPGNSGGPLLRAKDNVLIGVVAFGNSLSEQPPEVRRKDMDGHEEMAYGDPSSLSGQVLSWIERAYTVLKTFNVARPRTTIFEDAKFARNYGEMRYYEMPKKPHTFGWLQRLPTETSTAQSFNRIDVFSGFACPLGRFLQPDPSTQSNNGFRFIFSFQVLGSLVTNEVSVTFICGGKPIECLPARRQSGKGSTFNWQHETYSNSKEHIGTLPRDIFNYESGLCAIEEIDITVPEYYKEAGKGESYTASLEATYAFGKGKVDNAVKFKIAAETKDFVRTSSPRTWKLLIGERMAENKQRIGSKWNGPEVTTL